MRCPNAYLYQATDKAMMIAAKCAADDACGEIHSFLAYSHPGPRRQSTSCSVLFATFAAFFGDLDFSAFTSSFCGVSAFLAAFTVAACIAVATVWSTRPPLMPLLMAFLTALSIAFRAFFSDSFFAISQYLNRRLMPQLGIVQGTLPLFSSQRLRLLMKGTPTFWSRPRGISSHSRSRSMLEESRFIGHLAKR
jgi:hypothetical protein